ncbi:MAG: alpha/beta hydrolase [Sphingomonadales bacterium]|nr:alpha/beta hydrolase [Sphingomonadales bacterium]
MTSLLSILRHARTKKMISLFLLVYLIGAILLYFFQESLLFRSRVLPPAYQFSTELLHREITVPINTKDTLHAVLYRPDSGATKGLVLYFHGNRQNIGWYEKFVPYFTQYGYEVLMPDYPGYGKSKGAISEEKLYDWATLTYQMARKRYAADSLIIYGKSIGTGIATELAARRDCKTLILETPYYSFPEVLHRFMPIYPMALLLRYQLPTYRYLPRVAAPVTLLHGTQDGIVAFSQSQKLAKLFKPQDRLVVVEGGSHNDLYRFSKTTDWLSQTLGH